MDLDKFLHFCSKFKLYSSCSFEDLTVSDSFYLYSDAYLDSAKVLCQELIGSTNEEKYVYVRGAVILYLVYHSIELFLKGTVLSKCPDEKLSHDIESLERKYKKLYPAKKYRLNNPFNSDFSTLKSSKEYEIKFTQHQFHGYPTDKNKVKWPLVHSFQPDIFMHEIKILETDFKRIRNELKTSSEAESMKIVGSKANGDF